MSDVDISPETPNFLARVDYELSVEGRTSVLEGVGKKKFRWEDVASSRLAMIAGLRASLTATQEKLAAAEAALVKLGTEAIINAVADMDPEDLDRVEDIEAQIDAARNEGLEEAAKWHDAESACCDLLASTARTQVGADTHIERSHVHAKSAAALRALKSTAPVRDDARERALQKKALDAAICYIMKSEPSDSRAVSDIAVAIAAVSCGIFDDATEKVIDAFNTQDKP